MKKSYFYAKKLPARDTGRKPGIIVLPSRVWEAQDEADDSEMSALDRERRQTNHSGCEVCFPAAQSTRAFGGADGGVGRNLG